MSTVRRSAQGPTVAIAQISPVLGDLQANMAKHREAIWNAVAEGVDLLVFPELSLTGYGLKDTVPDVAISRGGPELQELTNLSKSVSLVVGFVEESSDHHFFNATAYLEGGRVVAVHRKVYLPTYGMFDEQRYFARGRMIRSFKTEFGQMAMLICEDMLHPTAAVVAALDGATTLIVPSASPARGVTDDSDDELDANGHHWESYNRTMARSLGVFVVHANRTGVEDGVTFWGGSEIVGPSGETLGKAPYYDIGQAKAVLADDTLRRRRIKNPALADEDADLVINELCRIRERRVPAVDKSTDERRPRFDDSRDRPPRRDFDGPRGRDDRGGGFGGDRDRGRGGFGGDRDGGERGRGSYGGARDDRGGGSPSRQRGGGFGGDRDDRPRGGGFGGNRDDRPRGGGFGGNRDDRPPRGGGFGGGRDDRPRGGGDRFAGGRDDRGGRGGYGGGRDDRGGGDRFGGGRDDRGGRGSFGGGRDDRGGGRGSFGGGREDRGGRGSFGGGRDDRPRGGGFGGGRDDRGGRGNFSGGRGGYGGARDDRGGGGYGGARDDRGGGDRFGGGRERDDRDDRGGRDRDDRGGRGRGREQRYFGDTDAPGRKRPAGGDERKPRKLSAGDVSSPKSKKKDED